MATHPYFVAKAREAFRRAGGDPDHSAALAAWAQKAREINDPDQGVIVAEDGEVVAETLYHRDCWVPASYVVPEDTKRYDLLGNEVGIALGQLRRKTGKQLIHLKMGEVCLGASQFIGAS